MNITWRPGETAARTPGWQASWRMIIAAAGPVAPPLEVVKAEQHELVLQRGHTLNFLYEM